MTKIYKAILSSELEKHTSDGWTWDNVERREQRVTEHHDYQGRIMTPAEREAHGYRDAYNAPRVFENQHFFGDVIIFIVWKDGDQIGRENAAEARASTAEFELKKLNEAAEKHAKAIEDLNRQLKESQEISHQRQQQIYARDDKNRKLEADIGKIRTVIGTEKMNEILDVKKPS